MTEKWYGTVFIVYISDVSYLCKLHFIHNTMHQHDKAVFQEFHTLMSYDKILCKHYKIAYTYALWNENKIYNVTI